MHERVTIVKLYDYFRSTASFRVRIALHYKGIDYECIPIHLVQDGGEQHKPFYKALNPQELVPTLWISEKEQIIQSLAILEYLEDTYPLPALLPKRSIDRAYVRSLANIIACDVHPLNNLRVLQYLRTHFLLDELQIRDWYHHWLKLGFDALELKLQKIHRTKPVCFGDNISFADLCLIPCIYNANRYQFSIEPYPTIKEINSYCLNLESFIQSYPSE